MTTELQRLDPQTVHQRLRAGTATLLVCAYRDEAKCRERMLKGATTLSELDDMPSLDKSVELVFYCG